MGEHRVFSSLFCAKCDPGADVSIMSTEVTRDSYMHTAQPEYNESRVDNGVKRDPMADPPEPTL